MVQPSTRKLRQDESKTLRALWGTYSERHFVTVAESNSIARWRRRWQRPFVVSPAAVDRESTGIQNTWLGRPEEAGLLPKRSPRHLDQSATTTFFRIPRRDPPHRKAEMMASSVPPTASIAARAALTTYNMQNTKYLFISCCIGVAPRQLFALVLRNHHQRLTPPRIFRHAPTQEVLISSISFRIRP